MLNTPFATHWSSRWPTGRNCKSDRAELHSLVAIAIGEQNPESVDENAALIAEHLRAAGDLRSAYGWHMRAGEWLRFRDVKAGRMSWQCARDVADQLPADDPDRTAMRIAPRALMCLSTFRAGGSLAETGFDELRDLATAAGDKASLAIGMAGEVSALLVHGRFRDAARLATEFTGLVKSIGDPAVTLSLLFAALTAKLQLGEISEVLRLSERIIDLADGDPTSGNLIIESPLAIARMVRATARAACGEPGWRTDLESCLALCREVAPVGYPVMLLYKYYGVPTGTVLPDTGALTETAEALELSQRLGDDWTLECARVVHGLVLVQHEAPDRADGFALLQRGA